MKRAAIITVGVLFLGACGNDDTSELDSRIAGLQSDAATLAEEADELRNQVAAAVGERDAVAEDLKETERAWRDTLLERAEALDERDAAIRERDAALAELTQLRVRFDPEIQELIANAQEEVNDAACAAAAAHARDRSAPAPDARKIADDVLAALPDGAAVDIAAAQARIDECTAAGEQEAALAALMQPKGNGFHTVGVEIAAGRWRSSGSGSTCYWAITPDGQPDNILSNHFGNAGGTVTLRDGQEFESDGCGQWEFLG